MQASTVSYWNLALATASAIEGVVKILLEGKPRAPEFSKPVLDDSRRAIKMAIQDGDLRQRLLSMIGQFYKPSARRALEDLANVGVLTRDEVGAWVRLRNHVAHGNLDLPWPDDEAYGFITALLEMLYKLTDAVIDGPFTKKSQEGC